MKTPRSDQILARTMKHADELTLLEQGKKVEEAQFFEDTRKELWETTYEHLKLQVWLKTQAVRDWEKRNDYAQQDREDKFLRADGMPEHGFDCPCDGCLEKSEQLVSALGLVPSGKPERQHLSVEPLIGRLRVPMRYRRDESDR